MNRKGSALIGLVAVIGMAAVLALNSFAASNNQWLVGEWAAPSEPDSLPPIDSTIVEGHWPGAGAFPVRRAYAGVKTVDSFFVGTRPANQTEQFRMIVHYKRGTQQSAALDSSVTFTNWQVAPKKPGPFTKLKVQ